MFLLFKEVTISFDTVTKYFPNQKEINEIVTSLHKSNILPNGICIFKSAFILIVPACVVINVELAFRNSGNQNLWCKNIILIRLYDMWNFYINYSFSI